MESNAIKCDEKLISALTQVVLNDALNAVIVEFERNTDTEIGRITIEPKAAGQDRRVIRIEVLSAGEGCLEGLARYKRVLCKDKRYKNEPFCASVA